MNKNACIFHKQATGSIRLIIIALFVAFIPYVSSHLTAATYYSVANGNWNSASTWATTSGGTAGVGVPATGPVAGDYAYIERGKTVTVSANASCYQVLFRYAGAVTALGTLTVNSGITLSIANSLQIANAPDASISATVNGTGNITATNLYIGNTTATTTAGNLHTLTFSGPTLTLSAAFGLFNSVTGSFNSDARFNFTSGNITLGTNLNIFENCQLNMTGGTLNLPRSLIATGIFNATGGTTNFTGSHTTPAITCASAGNVTFYNLTINKSDVNAVVTSSDNVFAVSNNLTITSGVLELSATNSDYAITGNLTQAASGTLRHSVPWSLDKKISVGGNVSLLGVYDYSSAGGATHLQMTNGGKTITTGTTSLSILTCNHSSGTISLSGNLSANRFWPTYVNGSAASFTINSYVVTSTICRNYAGTLNVTTGTLNVADLLYNGGGGVDVSSSFGLTNQTGGSINVGNITYIGDGLGATGEFRRSGGSFSSTGVLQIYSGSNYNGSGTTNNLIGGLINDGTFAPSGTTYVGGDFTNNGTFTIGTSTINFNGTTQTLGGSLSSYSFYRMTLSTGSNVITSSDITVSNNLVINSSAYLTVSENTSFTVVGTITNTPGVNGLLIKGSLTGANGTFIYPQGQSVSGTVEFYSKASWNLTQSTGSKYKWQYFGIPVSTLAASPTFDGAFVRKYNEAGNGAGTTDTPSAKRWLQLNNSSSMQPFLGYEIVQSAAKKYYIQGLLVNSNYSSGSLSYTVGADYPGMYIFSNPYTAAIDITTLTFGTETEASVYQYNTGSNNDWQTNTGSGSLAGQYIVSPKATAGTGAIPRYISSMQGFLVRKLNLNTSNLSNFTFGITYNTAKIKNTTSMRSKHADIPYTEIDVAGSRFSDKVWIFENDSCSKDYDNGWDGRKILGSILNPQLMVRDGLSDLQICATNNIGDLDLAFQAGEDSCYQIKFTHINVSFQDLYLLDVEKGIVTNISESGSSYNFESSNKTAPEIRFKIIKSGNITTGCNTISDNIRIFTVDNTIVIDNKSTNQGTFSLFDFCGKLIQSEKVGSGELRSVKTNVKHGNYIVKFKTENQTKTIGVMLN